MSSLRSTEDILDFFAKSQTPLFYATLGETASVLQQ